MCRYAQYGPYKDHFACFRCRKSFKRLPVSEWPKHLRPAEDLPIPAPCPQCGAEMTDMGLDFKPPPASDAEHWQVVVFLFERGFTFHSCGCGGPGFRPSRWAEVSAFLEAHRCRPAGEILAARFAARQRTAGLS